MFWNQIIQLGLLGCFAVFIAFVLGALIVPFFLTSDSNTPIAKLFFQLFFGAISLVLCYSIVSTRGVTINLLFFPLLFVLFKHNKVVEKLDRKHLAEGLKQLLMFLPFVFVFVVLSLSMVYPGWVEEDVLFYDRISEYFKGSGIHENAYHFFNYDAGLSGTVPYHYFELWFGAFLHRINFTSLHGAVIFRNVVYPVLLFMVFVGVMALIERIEKIRLYQVIIAFLFFFLSYSYIVDLFPLWDILSSVWLRPNFIVYYFFLTPFLLLLFQSNYLSAAAILLMLVVASVTALPAVFSSLAILFLFPLIVKKKITFHDRKLLLKGIVLVFATFLLFVFFYMLTAAKVQDQAQRFSSVSQVIAYTLSIWKAIAGFLISLTFRGLLLLFYPLVVIVLLKLFKLKLKLSFNEKAAVLAGVCMLIVTTIVFQFTTFIENTYQFPYIAYCLLALTSFVLLYRFMSTFGVGGSKAVKGVFILFMFAHLLLFRSDFKPNFNTDSIEEMYLSRRGYSKAYMASLINFAKENPNARGGFVLGPQELLKLNGGRQALTYQRGSHFAYLRNNNNLIPLTLPQTLYAGMDTGSLPYIKSKLGNSILSYYRHMPDTGVLTYTRSYIDKNIDFIVLSPSAKPEDVGLNEKSYFYIKDSLSGEALLSLMK